MNHVLDRVIDWWQTLVRHISYNPLPEGKLRLVKEKEDTRCRCYFVDENDEVCLAIGWNENTQPSQIYWLFCTEDLTIVVHLVNGKHMMRSFQLMCEVYSFEELTKEIILGWWSRLMNNFLVSRCNYTSVQRKVEHGKEVFYLYDKDGEVRSRVYCDADGAGVIHALEAIHPHPFYRIDITVDPHSDLYTTFMQITEAAKSVEG